MREKINEPGLSPKDARYLLLLFGLVFGLFIPNLMSQRPALGGPEIQDLGHQWLPYSYLFRSAYVASHFPLWDPYDLFGIPFLAFSHTSCLYPFSALQAFSFPLAMSLSILLHLLLAGLGSYLLIRSLGRSPEVSFIGSLSWSMAGGLFWNINFFPALYAYAWAPVLFLSGIKLAEELRAKWLLAFSFSFLFIFFGGDAETLIYVLFFLIWWIFSSRDKSPKTKAVLLFSAFALSLILILAQLLPLMELFHHSIRGQPAFSPVFKNEPGSFFIREVFRAFSSVLLLIFLLIGHPLNQGSIYYGFLFFPGVLVGVINKENQFLRYLGLFFILLTFYLLVHFNLFFRAFSSHLPILGKLLNPHSTLCTFGLGLIIIGSQGLEDFSHKKFPRLENATKYLLPAYGLLVLGISFLLKPALIARILLGLALVSFPVWRHWLKPKSWLVIIAILDLYGLAFFYFPREDFGKFQLQPELVFRLSNTELKGRYLILSPWVIKDSLLPFSAGMILKAESIDCFMRAPLWKQLRLLSLAFPQILLKKGNFLTSYDLNKIRDLPQISERERDFLDLFNLRWVISRLEVPALMSQDKYQLIEKKPLVYIYENQNPLPRAKLYHQIIKANSDEQGFELLNKKTFDLRKQLLIMNPEASLVKGSGADYSEPILLSRPSPDQLLVRFSSQTEGYLFLSESYYPGWRAELDRKEVRIWRADYAFRAVFAEPGEHNLRFYYQPVSFRLGLWCTVSSLLNLLTLSVFVLARKIRQIPKAE